MRAVVICPDRRPEVSFLARAVPLALVPFLGVPVLFLVLADLADRGARRVTILAPDRPDQIRGAVGGGERWGLEIEVLAESAEPRVDSVRQRFGVGAEGWLPGTQAVVVADRVPGEGGAELFGSCVGFHAVCIQAMGAAGKRRVGMKETAPGVWIGLRTRVDSTATLVAPCWLGDDAWVRARATVGAGSVVEGAALVDHDAEVVGSWVGPRTYLGSMVQVKDSMAWSDGLLSLGTGSFTEVVDPFLVGNLQGLPGFRRGSPWYGRLAALWVLLVTWFVPLIGWVRLRMGVGVGGGGGGGGARLFKACGGVVPSAVVTEGSIREMRYWELGGFEGVWRRWPQLWSIVRGDFTWVGNRPLTRGEAAGLETEFERLWLSAPVGLASLADSKGCEGELAVSDEARAHSGYYAVRAGGELDRVVLGWLLRRCLKG